MKIEWKQEKDEEEFKWNHTKQQWDSSSDEETTPNETENVGMNETEIGNSIFNSDVLLLQWRRYRQRLQQDPNNRNDFWSMAEGTRK